jgi:hypothetical protein
LKSIERKLEVCGLKLPTRSSFISNPERNGKKNSMAVTIDTLAWWGKRGIKVINPSFEMNCGQDGVVD